LLDRAQLQLDEHHVVAEAHAQVKRGLAAKKVINLRVVKRFQRLHNRVLGTLSLQGKEG